MEVTKTVIWWMGESLLVMTVSKVVIHILQGPVPHAWYGRSVDDLTNSQCNILC